MKQQKKNEEMENDQDHIFEKSTIIGRIQYFPIIQKNFTSEDLQKEYSQFMKNHPDGMISNVEDLQTYVPWVKDRALLSDLFDAADIDQNGKVDFFEYLVLVFTLTRQPSIEERLDFLFSLLDKSRSGNIGRKELHKAMETAAHLDPTVGNPDQLTNQLMSHFRVNSAQHPTTQITRQKFIDVCLENENLESLFHKIIQRTEEGNEGGNNDEYHV